MEATQKMLLKKAYENDIIGKHHLLMENFLRGFDDAKKGELKKAMKALINKKYLVRYQTKHGVAIYIPTCKVREIREILELP